MTPARWLTCIALCFLDVHVRAADPIFDAHDKRTTFTFANTRFVLAKGGLIAVEGKALRLVQGQALALGGLTLTTPFGRATCVGACEAIFTRTDDDLTIETLTDGWALTRTGDVERALPPATVTRVAGLAPDGRSRVTDPAALPWADLVRRWAKLYPDGAEKFTARVLTFRAQWDLAVANGSDTIHARALAMIQTKATADARAHAQARAEAEENAHLRQLFREKNYVE